MTSAYGCGACWRQPADERTVSAPLLVKEYQPDAVRSRQVFDLARQQSIEIAPGLIFSNSGRFERHIRLNCGYLWNAAIEDSVRTIGDIVRLCSVSAGRLDAIGRE